MPDRIDAAMDDVQSPSLQQSLNCMPTEPHLHELASRDDAVLPLGEARHRDARVTRPEFDRIIRHNSGRISHAMHRCRGIYARPMADVALDAPTAAPAAPPRADF